MRKIFKRCITVTLAITLNLVLLLSATAANDNFETNTDAKGTEVYYFYPFAKQLASSISLNASKHFASTNRGAKTDIFHVTLSSQVPGVLVETGFMTNKSDYTKLRKASYHQKLAIGIVMALRAR